MRVLRSLALVAALALLAGACASTADVVVSGSGAGDIEATSAPEATIAPAPTPDASSSPVPGTAPRDAPAVLLLQEGDLVGWDFTAAMAVPAEPVPDVGDCPELNAAFGAHVEPGTRVTASLGETELRQTAVELKSTGDATAVLDAAGQVWEECVQLAFGGAMWWSEPVGIPAPAGWRAEALALGSGDTIWVIGWWQRGATVVLVDLEGEQAWEVLQSLFDGIADRLAGEPAEVPAPDPRPTSPGTEPTPEPRPTPETPRLEPLPLPTGLVIPTPPAATPTPDQGFPPQGDDWVDHPLASLAIDPVDLGPGWEFQYGTLSEAEPGDPEDMIPGCPVAAPPTLDGFTLQYERDSDAVTEELELVIGGGDEAGAQLTIDAFRAVVACDLSESGFDDGLEEVSATLTGADDIVVLVGERTGGLNVIVFFGIARFDDVLIAAYRAYLRFDEGDGEDGEVPTVDDVLGLIEEISARR